MGLVLCSSRMSVISALLLSFLLFSTNVSQATAMSRYRGHWQKTWDAPSTSFPNANLGFAFSGWPDPNSALEDSEKVYNNLEGEKIITVGGGNGNGRWTSSNLQSVIHAIRTDGFRDYSGIAFDIEEGESGLTGQFLDAFSSAKSAGLLVVVTTHRTAPYDIGDAPHLMWEIVHCPDIDILSPMMYSSGVNWEQCSDGGDLIFAPSEGVPWSWFGKSQAAVVPSIWKQDFYSEARSFFEGQGIRTQGYITWC